MVFVIKVDEKLFHLLQDHLRVNSIRSKPSRNHPLVGIETLLPYGLPVSGLLELEVESCLKFVDFIKTLADVYRRIEDCPYFEKANMYLEQCAIFEGLADLKLFWRALRFARQHAVNVHSKIVLAAWLRYERREDELDGTCSMDCFGRNIECPKVTLVAGYNPESVYDPCICSGPPRRQFEDDSSIGDEECSSWSIMGICHFALEMKKLSVYGLVLLRYQHLLGQFCMVVLGSQKERINFSQNGIVVEGMGAVEVYSRTKRLDSFDPQIILELFSFSNSFCCDNLKSTCNAYLASLVKDMEDALMLIEFGLAKNSYLLVVACLQIFLRELPNLKHNLNEMKFFCSPDAIERLGIVGHASFLLYYFLSQIRLEEDMKSNITVMLLERMTDCVTKSWQQQLACHQLGVVMLERKEYKDAQRWFEVAFESGHIYSLVGVARAKYKRGHKYSAYKLITSLIFGYKLVGWMHQERSLYYVGKEKMLDLEMAIELDPTLSFR